MMEEEIVIEARQGWLRLVLNRPNKLNSLTTSMLKTLHAVFVNAAKDSTVRAILLTGNGRAFCAGQDLSDRTVSSQNGADFDLGESLLTHYNPLIRAIRDIPKPVVCAVNGVAAGAGANIALACDIVIAKDSASFIQAFSRIGLVPDSGGTWFLPRLAGGGRAAALAMLADQVPAKRAAEWGMIWCVTADDEFAQASEEIVQRLADGSTIANAAIKSLLNQSSNNSLEEQLQAESEQQRRCGRATDYQEGVAAFMEKRTPNFSAQ